MSTVAKFEKIYLHVGPDKTGSTAIQKVLKNNQSLIESFSFCFPDRETNSRWLASYFSSDKLNLSCNIVRLPELKMDEVIDRDEKNFHALLKRIDQTNARYLILSYEGFAELCEDDLFELKAFLLNYSENISLIYYLRSPVSYAVSAMSERVKHGELSWMVHPPIQPNLVYLSKLATVFGKNNIEVRSFARKDLVGADVVSDFFYTLGFDKKQIDSLSRERTRDNLSLSWPAMMIGDQIIQLTVGKFTPQAFLESVTPLLTQIEGEKLSLSTIQQSVIKAATSKAYKSILKQYSVKANREKFNNRPHHQPMSERTARSLAKLIIESHFPNLLLSDAPVFEFSPKKIRKPKGQLRYFGQQPLKLFVEEKTHVTVSVENQSNEHWHSKVLPVRLSYHWYDAKKRSFLRNGLRTDLPFSGINPGETLEMEMNVQAPSIAGKFWLKLTMVQEFCGWFEKRGFDCYMLPVEVHDISSN